MATNDGGHYSRFRGSRVKADVLGGAAGGAGEASCCALLAAGRAAQAGRADAGMRDAGLTRDALGAGAQLCWLHGMRRGRCTARCRADAGMRDAWTRGARGVGAH